jgi:hypothetical protein
MKSMQQMPGAARVWLYTASRFLNDQEVSSILQETEVFLQGWSSHGANMDAACGMYFNRILAIAADEAQAKASGCGIDKSVQFVKQLSESRNVDFFQRTTILYQSNEALNEAPLHTFWALRKALVVNDETLVVDTTISNVEQLHDSLLKPFRESWHAEMWGR